MNITLTISNDMSDQKSTGSAIDNAKNFLASFVEKLQNAGNKKFVFFLVGRTGVGKSSTVNSLMGKSVAQVGDYEPTTMGIESYESEINGINFTVFDTPGLCDDVEEEGNDEKYLGMMCSKVTQIDSMWFVSRLDETRVTADEKRGIQLISEAFTPNVWEHAVIVFTYANSIEKERYREALDKRTELIKKEIAKYATNEVAKNIPSVAVDNKSKTTPDGKEWLGELYTKVFSRISERAVLPYLMATADSIRLPHNADKKSSSNPKEPNWRFAGEYSFTNESEKRQEPRINLDDIQKEVVKKKIIDAGIIPTLAVAGAGVGAAFGPVGAAMGGAVGAVVGLVAWLLT